MNGLNLWRKDRKVSNIVPFSIDVSHLQHYFISVTLRVGSWDSWRRHSWSFLQAYSDDGHTECLRSPCPLLSRNSAVWLWNSVGIDREGTTANTTITAKTANDSLGYIGAPQQLWTRGGRCPYNFSLGLGTVGLGAVLVPKLGIVGHKGKFNIRKYFSRKSPSFIDSTAHLADKPSF